MNVSPTHVAASLQGNSVRRRTRVSRFFTVLLMVSGPVLFAQSSEVSITNPKETPVVGRFLRPFHLEKRQVAPAKLTNTPRLESLVRGGNLYLSVQDVIALVLENNLDIAVQRYAPFLAKEVLRRAEGGGILRGVDTPIVAGPTSVSTAGISSNATVGGGALNAGGSVITAIGPGPPTLDPGFFIQVGAGHTTQPQTNTVLVGTEALTNVYRNFATGYSQSFITGTNINFTFYNSRSFINSSSVLFNPTLSGFLDFQINQPLLQGFSRAVNDRQIRVAKNNLKLTDVAVKLQVATTVSAALNLYWDLVSFNDAVRIKERAVAVVQDLYEGNKKQVAIGAMAGIEVTRAAAAVSVSKEDLLIAQTNVAQQEIVLKNMLNRNGIENTWLDDVHIIPLDHIEVPQTEEIRPVQDLLQEALSSRLEVKRDKINLESQQILLKGTRNGLLPSLSAFAEFTNNGLGGPANPSYIARCGGDTNPADNCAPPNPYFLGGNTSVFAQVLGRAYPNYSAGFSLSLPFRNRQAQADYVTDQLQVRQAELGLQRVVNQIRVEVKSNVIGLQQARSRYETAVASRVLAEQTLDAEQRRFQAGAPGGSVALVIGAQQGLATAQDAEVQAMANYTHNKIAFDMALGRALEVNHISMTEAMSGHVARESVIPANVPPARTPGGKQ
jgi:outer membrane protein